MKLGIWVALAAVLFIVIYSKKRKKGGKDR